MSQAHPVSFPDFPKLTSPASPKKNGHSRKIAAGDEAAIFDLIPASVVVLDREHTIVDLNETAARTAGRSKQTCVGLKVWEIFDNPDCRAGTCAASQAVKSGLRCEGVGRPLIQGKEVPVLISAAPRLSSEGEIIGVVEVILPTLGDVALSEEIQRLAEAAKAGRLSDRIPENRFDGRHLGTVRLINQMMDAMMQPIRMTTQYLGLLSQGKIPEKITDDYEGDLNTIKNDLNECGNALRGLAEVSLVLERMAVNDLSVNATEGYPGIFGKLCHSVNEAQGRVRNAIRVVKQVAIGDFRQELEILEQVGKRSDMDEFVPAFITMMRSLGALVSDAEMLADAAAAGKFDTRADAAKHNGEYRSVVAGVNTTLDIVVDKLNWYQSIIDALPLPIHVLDKNMNWVFLNKAFERLMVQNKIVRNREEAQGLPCSNAAASICKTAGCGVRQLEMGTNESYFDWHGQECKQETSKLVNLKGEHIGYVEAVQDLTEIVRNRQYTKHEVERLEANLTKLAQGDFALDLQIADADQHTAESNAQFAKISSNLAKVKSAVQAMCADAEMLVRAAVDGSLTTRADASKHGGDFRKIVEGVNSTLDAVIGPLNVAADYVDKISKGQIPPRIDENYNGDFNAIKNNLNRCIDALNGLTNEMRRMSDAHNAGDIDALIPLDKFDGAYRTMADGVNEMVAGHITVKKKAMACIAEFGKGNFEASLDRFPGKKAFINDTIEAVRANLKALITDTNLLVQAAVQGKLSTRADAGKHGGDFRKIVEGVNATLDAVIGPLQEVGQVLDKMAGGDLTVQAVNEYAGDFNRLRNTVNTLASQFRSAIQQIGANANSLVSAAEELNKVSQQMGASADETATQANVVSAASEQVAANVQTVATGADEMGASIKEIAKNTADATRVAMAAVKSAEATNETIGKLGQSSAEIGQVIKVITSIAQQTNLLALNATIEAARAGEAGKGFAVVANEVKELAKETAKATEDISRKIEAIQGDTKGAVAAIGQIGSVIVQINDIQNTIASAVEEQSATTNEISRNLAEAAHGSSDITRNIGGVAEAARSTTAGAMDTQKSAQSLERMSAELQGLISQFKF